jgi:ribonuclease HI
MPVENKLSIQFDGGCGPKNPGGIATFGWLVKLDGEIIESDCGEVCRGIEATNNVAEWSALLRALRYLKTAPFDYSKMSLQIRGDSDLVIKQLVGRWKCKAEHLRGYLVECRALLASIGFAYWDAAWIPRERNTEADALTNQAFEEANERDPLSLGVHLDQEFQNIIAAS